MKIPKHILKYLEGELISYPIHKKALAQARQNIYLQQSVNGYASLPQKTNYASSKVESKVMYLMADQNILRLERTVSAIEDVLNELPAEYKKLVELRYFKAYSVQKVADELSICVRNVFNWRDKLIHFFALRFGLI